MDHRKIFVENWGLKLVSFILALVALTSLKIR